MLSHATNEVGRGWGFGIHEAMDQIGTILGPLVLSFVLYLKLGYREGFAILAIPAALAITSLIVARLKFPHPRGLESKDEEKSGRSISLPSVFWLYTLFIVLAVEGFANFPLISFHFKTQAIVPDAQIPIFFAIAMGVDAVCALIVGRLYDRIGISLLFLVSLFTLPIPFLVSSHSYPAALAGMVIWGL